LVPGRVAQELLQLARRSPNLLRNVLHVLTLDRERQTDQVLVAPSPSLGANEETAKASMKHFQTGQQRLQVVGGHACSLLCGHHDSDEKHGQVAFFVEKLILYSLNRRCSTRAAAQKPDQTSGAYPPHEAGSVGAPDPPHEAGSVGAPDVARCVSTAW